MEKTGLFSWSKERARWSWILSATPARHQLHVFRAFSPFQPVVYADKERKMLRLLLTTLPLFLTTGCGETDSFGGDDDTPGIDLPDIIYPPERVSPIDALNCESGELVQWDGEKWICGMPLAGSEPSILNVKDFGAVGDGITDDTAAIQATINAAPSGGATVIVPPGVYLVSEAIHINDGGLHFSGRSMGSGRQDLTPTDPLYGSVIKAVDGFTGEALMDVGVLDVGTKQRIIIENLFLYCHDQPIDGLRLLNTNNPFLAQNLAIYNCGGIGVHVPYADIEGAVQMVAGRFNNLYVRNNGQGMRFNRMNSSVVENSVILKSTGIGAELIDGNNNTFRDTIFEMNGAEGLVIEGDTPGLWPESILVENCRFEKNNYETGGSSLVIGQKAHGVVVSGGRFQSDDVGIRIAGGNVSVLGAEFVTGDRGSAIAEHSIAIESTANETLILNPSLWAPSGTIAGIDDLGSNTTLLGIEGRHTWRDSNGQAILHIDPAAQVGVGTEEPAYSLDVEGEIRTTGGIVFPDGTTQTTACVCE